MNELRVLLLTVMILAEDSYKTVKSWIMLADQLTRRLISLEIKYLSTFVIRDNPKVNIVC